MLTHVGKWALWRARTLSSSSTLDGKDSYSDTGTGGTRVRRARRRTPGGAQELATILWGIRVKITAIGMIPRARRKKSHCTAAGYHHTPKSPIAAAIRYKIPIAKIYQTSRHRKICASSAAATKLSPNLRRAASRTPFAIQDISLSDASVVVSSSANRRRFSRKSTWAAAVAQTAATTASGTARVISRWASRALRAINRSQLGRDEDQVHVSCFSYPLADVSAVLIEDVPNLFRCFGKL